APDASHGGLQRLDWPAYSCSLQLQSGDARRTRMRSKINLRTIEFQPDLSSVSDRQMQRRLTLHAAHSATFIEAGIHHAPVFVTYFEPSLSVKTKDHLAATVLSFDDFLCTHSLFF